MTPASGAYGQEKKNIFIYKATQRYVKIWPKVFKSVLNNLYNMYVKSVFLYI